MKEFSDPYQLQRFLDAQDPIYDEVITELRSGEKHSHWMWFIFPQVEGLGTSPTSRFYAIKSLAEAEGFLEHPILGARLLECCQTLLGVQFRSAFEIFGHPDDWKLQSSMTLFSIVSPAPVPFDQVLERYFEGIRDERTIQIVKGWMSFDHLPSAL